MASFNKVILMGNLTRDPDVRQTTGGMIICTLGLAMNRRYTTSSGQEREETCFVDIDVFGRQAESCRTYLRKGSPALVEGALHMDQWDDKATGKRRSRLLVRADRVQFLSAGPGGSRDGRGFDDGSGDGTPQPPPQQQRRPAAPAGNGGYGGGYDRDDQDQRPAPPPVASYDRGNSAPPSRPPPMADDSFNDAPPPMDDIPF